MLQNRVVALREAHGLTQGQLARKIGVAQTMLSAIEKNDGYTPRVALMEKICRYFDVPLGWAWWFDGEPMPELDEEPVPEAVA